MSKYFLKNATIEIGDKYHLSTDGYYFIYEKNWINEEITANLFDENDNQVDVCYVTKRDLDHHKVINWFEARLTLKANQA